jgi:hypothetical protein
MGATNARERKLYRDMMQKKGVSVPNAQHPTPMTATPVSHSEPGLGAKTIAHPFKSGKPNI